MDGDCKIFILLTSILSLCNGELETTYMASSCNTNIGEKVGGRLETDIALQYTPLLDCWTTISVKSGKTIYLKFQRFDVEQQLNGVCVDSLKIYNGPSTSSALLTSEMCGSITNVFDFTTTGTSVTFHFKSDNNANFQGFEVLYTAVSSPPCGSEDFACSNGVWCIDKTLECDGIDQCGDNSDEGSCSAEALASKQDKFPIGIIIGCVVGGLVLILIIVIIIYKVYKYYYWKNWLERNGGRKYPWEENDGDLYRYPKTDLYQVHEIGRQGRLQPKVSKLFVEEKKYYENTVMAEEFTRYLDEK